MKTLTILLMLLLACDKPEPLTITGHWQGIMYLCKEPYPIEFAIFQKGKEISGLFYSSLGSGLIELCDSSSCISSLVVIVATDTLYGIKYIFSGTYSANLMSGRCNLIIYDKPFEDSWTALRK